MHELNFSVSSLFMLGLLLSYLIDSGIVVVSWFLRCACSAHRFVLTLKSLPVGNWKPGEIPTKELLTLISSRIKNQKKKGVIRERKNPEVPSLVLEEKQVYSEEEDRVAYKYYPRCWRCSQRCRFCLKRKKFFPNVGNFTMEWVHFVLGFHILHKL